MRNNLFRLKILELLGNKCSRCGNIENLEIDHKLGDGSIDRTLLSQHGILRYYFVHKKEAIKRLQLLCKNCHKLKHSKKFRMVNFHTQIDEEISLQFKEYLILKYGKLKSVIGLELGAVIKEYLENNVESSSLQSSQESKL